MSANPFLPPPAVAEKLARVRADAIARIAANRLKELAGEEPNHIDALPMPRAVGQDEKKESA